MTSKYKNIKIKLAGSVFDSKKEAQRYIELQQLEKYGKVKELERQKAFELLPKQTTTAGAVRKVEYVADFYYYDVDRGEYIAEDIKSNFTKKDPVYIIKKKLFLWRYDITFFENEGKNGIYYKKITNYKIKKDK